MTKTIRPLNDISLTDSVYVNLRSGVAFSRLSVKNANIKKLVKVLDQAQYENISSD